MFPQEIIPMQGRDFEIPFYQYVEVILVTGLSDKDNAMAWPGKMGLGHNQASADILRWILHQLTVDSPSVSACSTFSSSWISLKKKTIIIIINRLSKVIAYTSL